MKIKYKTISTTVDVANGDTVTLYSVPKDYSEDGLFIAIWGQHELEPVPSCDRPVCLLHVSVTETGFVEHFKAKGVTYA